MKKIFLIMVIILACSVQVYAADWGVTSSNGYGLTVGILLGIAFSGWAVAEFLKAIGASQAANWVLIITVVTCVGIVIGKVQIEYSHVKSIIGKV